MKSEAKIALLQSLREKGAVREECPVHNGYGGTAYWRFSVLDPSKLPASLKPEFERTGELRW